MLSADKALSIQVHPTRAQAEAGYQAENRRGLAPGDPARNYVDDWPKPELLYALTPFEVVVGLRTPADAADLLRALAVDQLGPLAGELSAATSEQAMAGALASVLEWPEPSRAGLVAEVVVACSKLAASGSQVSPYADACAAAVRVAADHPGDIGVLALLLMRHEVLQPGQAVFMQAGGLHAYLRGTGIELLANSNNVVRSGLTGKHIDVPELLKLLDPAVLVPVLSPRVLADGVTWFDTPAPEFRLYLLDLTGPSVTLPGHGPRILLCLDGACVLRSASGETLELRRGASSVPRRRLRAAFGVWRDARASPRRLLLHLRRRRPGRSGGLSPPRASRSRSPVARPAPVLPRTPPLPGLRSSARLRAGMTRCHDAQWRWRARAAGLLWGCL